MRLCGIGRVSPSMIPKFAFPSSLMESSLTKFLVKDSTDFSMPKVHAINKLSFSCPYSSGLDSQFANQVWNHGLTRSTQSYSSQRVASCTNSSNLMISFLLALPIVPKAVEHWIWLTKAKVERPWSANGRLEAESVVPRGHLPWTPVPWWEHHG